MELARFERKFRLEADLALPHPIHVDHDARFPITARSQVR
jgi:hypothetical protein